VKTKAQTTCGNFTRCTTSAIGVKDELIIFWHRKVEDRRRYDAGYGKKALWNVKGHACVQAPVQQLAFPGWRIRRRGVCCENVCPSVTLTSRA